MSDDDWEPEMVKAFALVEPVLVPVVGPNGEIILIPEAEAKKLLPEPKPSEENKEEGEEKKKEEEVIVIPPDPTVFFIYQLDPSIGHGYTLVLEDEPRFNVSINEELSEIHTFDPRSNTLIIKSNRYPPSSEDAAFYSYDEEGVVQKVRKNWILPQQLENGRYAWALRIGSRRYLWKSAVDSETRWALYHISDQENPVVWVQVPTDTDDTPYTFTVDHKYERHCNLIVGSWAYVVDASRLEKDFTELSLPLYDGPPVSADVDDDMDGDEDAENM